MRLDPVTLERITGRKRKRLQARWFLDYLGVDVPCDRQGPIITERSYEALVAKRLGVLPSASEQQQADRPQVRLRAA